MHIYILAVTTQKVIVDILQKPSAQCLATAEHTNKILGIINKGKVNKTESIIIPLYKIYAVSTPCGVLGPPS